MPTHFGPGPFFLVECFVPSFRAFARKVAVTVPQAMRWASRRAEGSSCSTPVAWASESSWAWVIAGACSSGLSGDWAAATGASAKRATAETRADARPRIDLMSQTSRECLTVLLQRRYRPTRLERGPRGSRFRGGGGSLAHAARVLGLDPRDQRRDLGSIGLVGGAEVVEKEAFLLSQLDDGTGEEQGQSQQAAQRIAHQSRSRQGEEEAVVDGMAGERVRADADQGVIRLQHHPAAPEPPDEDAGPGGEAEPHRAQHDSGPGCPGIGGGEGGGEGTHGSPPGQRGPRN